MQPAAARAFSGLSTKCLPVSGEAHSWLPHCSVSDTLQQLRLLVTKEQEACEGRYPTKPGFGVPAFDTNQISARFWLGSHLIANCLQRDMKSASSASDTYSGPDLRMLACISAHIIIALTFSATCSRGSHHDTDCFTYLSNPTSLLHTPSTFCAQPCCTLEQRVRKTCLVKHQRSQSVRPASRPCCPVIVLQRHPVLLDNVLCGQQVLFQSQVVHICDHRRCSCCGRCSRLIIAGPAQTS